MRLRLVSVAALLAGTGFVSGASAADLPEPTVETLAVNWTGFYAGLAAGGGIINYDTDVLGGLLNVDGFGGQGGLVEGTIGADYQLGNLVLGLLGDIHWSNLKSELTIPALGGFDATLETQWGFDALARIGVLVTDRALVYALGGYSWEQFEGRLRIPAVGVNLSDEEDSSGWTLGAGLEVLLTNNLSVKGEYRFTGFDDFDFNTGGILSMQPNRQTARIGVNYRLNAPYGGPGVGYAAPGYAQGPADWTGFYAGLAGGGGFENFDTNIAGGAANLDGFGGQGWLAEGSVGYDRQLGRIVIGALGDGNWSNIESTASLLGIVNASLQEQWGVDALARAGVLVNDRSLVYLLGGWSWEQYEGRLSVPLAGINLTDKQTTDGGTVGAGVEIMATNTLSIKGEYRYTQFDSFDFGTGGAIDLEPNRQTARLGVNYKLHGMPRQ